MVVLENACLTFFPLFSLESPCFSQSLLDAFFFVFFLLVKQQVKEKKADF